jgi:glycosyltransferase involved in cell wall biosynthesis
MSRSLRIAMIGQRGLPATHGGIERHVEEIGARLVERGHEVVAFCRPGYSERTGVRHRGIYLAKSRTVPTKHLEAFVHSGTSTLAALGREFDIVHFHAIGPGLFAPLPKFLSQARVVQTIHGLDDQRAKWGNGAQRVLRVGGWLSARVPDEIVVVSRSLQDHYLQTYGRTAHYVTNGAPVVEHCPDLTPALRALGIENGRYILFVGRLVPEKDPAGLLAAFAQVDTDMRLVLVGGSSFTEAHVNDLEEMAARDPRVVMLGFRYGDELAGLYSHAALFVQPSLLEGLPITLLEAAAYGLPVVVSDIAPHLEVLGVTEPGRETFPAGDVKGLTKALQCAVENLDACSRGAASLHADVSQSYDWDLATTQLLEVYEQALQGGPAQVPLGHGNQPDPARLARLAPDALATAPTELRQA